MFARSRRDFEDFALNGHMRGQHLADRLAISRSRGRIAPPVLTGIAGLEGDRFTAGAYIVLVA